MPQPNAPQPNAPKVVLQIIIELLENGNIQVNGNIDDKMVALGIIECAKEAILMHHLNKARRIMAPPAGLDPNKLKVQ